MKEILELEPRTFIQPGPDPMTESERKAFFNFYKKHKSRALFGFFQDIRRSATNNLILSKYFRSKHNVRCLIVGSSYWANPVDLAVFIKQFNEKINFEIAVLDVLPDAILEGIKRNVAFMPILAPAQDTPFCNESFDILIADGLLNCCCFGQHEPIIKELYRILMANSILLLGLSHSENERVVKWHKRPIASYSRPLNTYKKLFQEFGFFFPEGSTIITPFVSGSGIFTANCIAIKKRLTIKSVTRTV